MAEVQYQNGVWYVAYENGSVERCHNRVTAEYLVRRHNEDVAELSDSADNGLVVSFNDPVSA